MKNEQGLKLRQYLLGELNEQERESLAEKYFVEEELFNELLEIENELFDQYVRDELSPIEKKQFASYIQSLPDGNFKLATAQALSQASASEKASTTIREESIVESASLWQSIRNLFFGRQNVFQYAMASLLLIALASVVYFYIYQRQLQKENEQLRARVSQSEKDKENLDQQAKDTEHEKSEQQERIEQLEEELARIEAQKEKTTEGTQDTSVISTIATLILTPTLRSANKPDLLRLKPEIKIVSITVKFVSREQIESFRAVLQINDGGGQIVLTRENLKPAGTLQNRRITFTIPAKKLTERSYKVTLQGRTTDGIEIVQEHYFEVVGTHKNLY